MPKILGTWFPPKRLATVNGLCFASLTLGSALAMGTSVRLLSPAFNGWRGTTVFVGVLGLIMGILWIIFYKDPKTETSNQIQKTSMGGNFKTVLKVRDVRLFAIYYGLLVASLMGIFALLPISLQEKGITNAGELIAIMILTSMFSKIAGGILSDKMGKRKIFIIVGTIIFAISIPGFIVFKGFALIFLLFIAGLFSGPTSTTLLTASVEIEGVGTSLAGTALGFIIMIGTIGGSIGPFLSGMIMDATGMAWPGFVFLGLSGILGVLIILPTKTK
jgi:cyanate permease